MSGKKKAAETPVDVLPTEPVVVRSRALTPEELVGLPNPAPPPPPGHMGGTNNKGRGHQRVCSACGQAMAMAAPACPHCLPHYGRQPTVMNIATPARVTTAVFDYRNPCGR